MSDKCPTIEYGQGHADVRIKDKKKTKKESLLGLGFAYDHSDVIGVLTHFEKQF